ncbi:MAG: NYN domain-containing protein [bacterium]|nr:NYN domain-containing protein [bacterium]
MNMRDRTKELTISTATPPRLTALFIDFDNIYISLLSRDRFAATHFATNPVAWTSALLTGGLSTSSINNGGVAPRRRMIIARVYGNPVLKNKDRSSFAYVRNHFMHAGYEVIDCPPLTNQLKNGSDIRMVLDMRDWLEHNPRVDEFVIMSGDSDFVPILLRLRAHDRRTMIYGGLQTAKSYTSLADEIITEDALVAFLHESAGRPAPIIAPTAGKQIPSDPLDEARREIIEEVSKIVEDSDKPVSMELLATSVRNTIGLKRTIDTKWAGHGQFSVLLAQALSQEFMLSSTPPYMVWHKKLHKEPAVQPEGGAAIETDKQSDNQELIDIEQTQTSDKKAKILDKAGSTPKPLIENVLQVTDIPFLSARYYHRLFDLIAVEITQNGFVFTKTANNTAKRGEEIKLPVDPEHVQIILHRIRRHGHWFNDKDSALSLAQAFRDSVISECAEADFKLTNAQQKSLNDWFLPVANDQQASSNTKNSVAKKSRTKNTDKPAPKDVAV